MQVTFLGTGTSQGIPVIACDCVVCQSNDPRNHRLRCSVHIKTDEGNDLVIDIGPDFRQQILRARIHDLDAILLTHEHNDHIIGMDDIRPFNFMRRKNMPVFSEERVQRELIQRFEYIFESNPYPGAPRVTLYPIEDLDPFFIENTRIIPIRVMHGQLPVLGFRIGGFTYITDAKTIPDDGLERIHGSDVLVLNALHRREHHSHLNLDQAVELAQKLEVGHCYLIHISHAMGLHEAVEKELPDNVSLAYDGLTINL